MAVTLQRIAREGKVSVQTVSTVLNGRHGIGRETRERIAKLADELGYRTNAYAKAMRTGRTGGVGMLMNPRQGGSQRSLDLEAGIVRTLGEYHMYVTKGYLPLADDNEPVRLPRILRDWMVDGLILDFPHLVPQEVQEILDRHDVPAVWTNNNRAQDSVYPDDFAGAKLATEHLLRAGHRKIAYMNVRFRDQEVGAFVHFSVIDRQAGYESAMRSAGLTPHVMVSPIAEDYARHDMVAVSLQLFQQPDRPTAVVCYSDGMPIYIAALKLGLRVPEQLSIVCFSDLDEGTPDECLSRLVVPFNQVGRRAVEMLIKQIESSGESSPSVVVPYADCSDRTIAPPADGR